MVFQRLVFSKHSKHLNYVHLKFSQATDLELYHLRATMWREFFIARNPKNILGQSLRPNILEIKAWRQRATVVEGEMSYRGLNIKDKSYKSKPQPKIVY